MAVRVFRTAITEWVLPALRAIGSAVLLGVVGPIPAADIAHLRLEYVSELVVARARREAGQRAQNGALSHRSCGRGANEG